MTSENTSAKRETVADIVREMRELHTETSEDSPRGDECRKIHVYAHRIEAAHAREVDKSCEYALMNGGCSAWNMQLSKLRKLSVENEHLRKEVEVRAIIAGVSLADGECQRLRDENALLRKALEPILDYNTDLAAWDTYDARCQHAYDAIRKAQAIMKGESKC